MPEKLATVLGGWKLSVNARLLATLVVPAEPKALVVMVVTEGLVTLMLTPAGTVVLGASAGGDVVSPGAVLSVIAAPAFAPERAMTETSATRSIAGFTGATRSNRDSKPAFAVSVARADAVAAAGADAAADARAGAMSRDVKLRHAARGFAACSMLSVLDAQRIWKPNGVATIQKTRVAAGHAGAPKGGQ